MAKCRNLDFIITSHVIVSDNTAEHCVQLLAMYLDDHPEKTLLIKRDKNGKRHVKIDDLTAPERDDALVIAHASDIPRHREQIWMETREGSVFPVEYKRWDVTDYVYFYDRYDPYNEAGWRADSYNCEWRCWTKKPSRERRQAVAWSEA